MFKCTSCGRTLGRVADVCETCGALLCSKCAEGKCPECGASITKFS